MKQKFYVIHENLEWTQHLVKWLEELEVPYKLWDLSSGILDLQSPPPQGIFYNRMSALLTQEDIVMRQNLQSK